MTLKNAGIVQFFLGGGNENVISGKNATDWRITAFPPLRIVTRRRGGGGEDRHGKLRCTHHLVGGRPVIGVWESAITLRR